MLELHPVKLNLALLPVISGIALISCPVRSETTLIDLDTAPGAYSVWRQSDLSSRSVSFVAIFAQARTDEKWAPRYTIQLGDGAKKTILFSVTYVPGYPPIPEATLSSSDKKVTLTPEPNLATPIGESCPVRLEWGDGWVKLTADGKLQEYEVGFTPTQIEIAASTGELEVKNIAFGR